MSLTSPIPNVKTAAVIRMRGVRTHNLRSIDVDLPRDKLVVITGVSGSGKSSLAFDTLFAEGQRRFLDSLSASTRQVLDQIERPDFDEIDGLPPTLSLEQRAGQAHRRSTLATTTEIYDFLRLWYAKAGTPHCPQCGRAVTPQSAAAIVDTILSREIGRKVLILAPLVRGRKGTHRELFERICREGFVRARVDGEVIDAATPPELRKSKVHDIDVVVDRIVIKEGLRSRLSESVELALKLGDGTCLFSEQTDAGNWEDHLYSSRFACPLCELSFPAIEPRSFSFNSPYGACPACQGLGVLGQNDKQPVVPFQVCPDCSGARIGPAARAVTAAGIAIHQLTALPVLAAREFVEAVLRSDSTGSRSPAGFSPAGRLVTERILPDVLSRLRFLEQVGLGYLTLDRSTHSLSGGEYQRARLTGCLGAGLIGVCYILDEPTVGLHPRDTQRLLRTLLNLRDQGNSVLVVEHDIDVMEAAEYLVDLGPGAGTDGGRIVACGTPQQVAENPSSVTGEFLRPYMKLTSARATLETRHTAVSKHRAVIPAEGLRVSGAKLHNLRNVSVEIPLKALVAVTGVSGSGKTSLILETLIPLLRESLRRRTFVTPADRNRSAAASIPKEESTGLPPGELLGAEAVERLVLVDQSPLGRSGRSNPATASGMWDEIRRLFARTKEARVRGFRAARFSFNAAGGRCNECLGRGTRRLAMHFLPDLELICPVCRGARFNRETLQVRFRGLSVAETLELRIAEAAEVFQNFASLANRLQTFVDVGLGYLQLGQSAPTLSGGEAQRIRLATELSRPGQGRTLYVLDEPTTGLHPADVARLLLVLQHLVNQGHSVVVIEHNLDVIAAADWVIDLGPEGGAGGGLLVANGTPEEVSTVAGSLTGNALRGVLPIVH
jgi:excinuclease ABC subunit A